MKQLSVLHVIPSISQRHGGPSVALPLFARALAPYDVKVTIATTDDDGPDGRLDVPLNEVVSGPGESDHIYFRKNTEFYKISWTLARWLTRHVADYDLVHIHALFSFSSFVAARAARRAHIPYIVRPLGVLNEWGMKNRRRLLKRWSLKMVELPIMRGAAAIHYTAEAEQREAVKAHPEIVSFSSIIIPIPIGDAQRGDAALFHRRFPTAAGRRIILFLSRLDPKKGVELLLSAFAEIRGKLPDALLVIAGSGEEGCTKNLQQKAHELGCDKDILWPGAVTGEEKAALFAAAALFVLPSFSENFGIAAAEALAAGIPSILSDQVAIAQDANAANAALIVPCETAAIAGAMRKLLGHEALRDDFGARGRGFIKERFSQEAIGGRLAELYRNVVKERTPTCST
ncbi:MAG: hypothetical protein V7609_815 [Verrucomicrobiota bacterium]